MTASVVIYRGADEALSLHGVAAKKGRQPKFEDLNLIKKPVFITDDHQILFIGSEDEDWSSVLKNKEAHQVTLSGGLLLPGFVEAHTHLVHGGDRKDEFEMRIAGKSYEEIAQAGGGIASTLKKTREATQSELLESSQKSLDFFKSQGVVCCEVKSGYGLNLEDEIKILKVIERLEGTHCVSTFLGLHSLPSEFTTFDEYTNFVCTEVLPKVQAETLCRRADIFVDRGYFELAHLKQLSNTIKKMGWDLTLHGDQLSAQGASLWGAQNGAKSVDHAVHLSDEELKKIAKSEAVIMALPGADFYLDLAYPRVRELIDHGGKVALATDFNPGSSPTQNIDFIGLLARLKMKMSLAEVLAAYTYNAASALGLENKYGSLEVGKSANAIHFEAGLTDLFYDGSQKKLQHLGELK